MNISFNVNLEDLEDIDNSSLLFDSATEVASLEIGDFYFSLMVRGEVRIIYKGDTYKYASNYTEELRNALKNGIEENEDLQIIDNNWFQLEVLKKVEENKYEYLNEFDTLDIYDVEGTLKGNKSVALYSQMVEYIKDIVSKAEDEDLKKLDLSNL